LSSLLSLPLALTIGNLFPPYWSMNVMSNAEEHVDVHKSSPVDLEPRLDFSAESPSPSPVLDKPSFIARMPWVSDPLEQTKIAFALSSAAVSLLSFPLSLHSTPSI